MPDTIFMIHGMWGSVRLYWDNWKAFFEARGYRCLTPTLRFHNIDPGEEPDPRLGTTSVLDYVEDLENEISKLEETPIVMGHSMGGLLAQVLGSRGLAKALVLLTPASPRGINALKFSVIRSFIGPLTRWGFWRKPNKLSFKSYVYAVLHLMSPEEQRELYDRCVYESGRAAAEIGFWLFDKNRATEVDESKMMCPVLVIAGEEDRITPVSVSRKVAEKYGATYKEFPNRAHWVIGEPGWEEIAEYVAGWMTANVI